MSMTTEDKIKVLENIEQMAHSLLQEAVKARRMLAEDVHPLPAPKRGRKKKPGLTPEQRAQLITKRRKTALNS